MPSLRALSLLLLLLVAVPTAILAGLGLGATTGLEAELEKRLEQELQEASLTLQAQARQAVERHERRASEALTTLADVLARRLPQGSSGDLWSQVSAEIGRLGALRRLGVLWDARVIAPDGRSLLPQDYHPDGTSGLGDAARLIADLRGEAERALYGPGGKAQALDVWARAEAALTQAGLRDALTVERAWTWLRAEGAAAAEVPALQGRSKDYARSPSARTWVLLLLHAAPEARVGVRQALAALQQDGLLDSIPLTRRERRAVAEIVRPLTTGPGGPELRRWRALLPAGLSLELECDVLPLIDQQINDLVGRRGDIQVPGHVILTHLGSQPPKSVGHREHVVSLPLVAGASRWFRLEHAQAAELRAEVAARRRWTTVGVVSLVVVVGLGLTLVHRALRRERAAVKLRDDFLANVSHELRTPLTSVCLHADLLAEERVPDEQRRAHAQVVRAEGARLATLVGDLLDVGALERGGRRPEPEPVDVRAAVERAVEPLRVLAQGQGRGLALDVGAAGAALADPHALARILANLLRNALDHGAGRIHVQAASDPLGTRIEVRDDGPGIPAAERARLFERFRRGSTAKGTRGTGLGLALSRALARAMGGDLVLLDDATRTVFRLTLPPVPPDGSPT